MSKIDLEKFATNFNSNVNNNYSIWKKHSWVRRVDTRAPIDRKMKLCKKVVESDHRQTRKDIDINSFFLFDCQNSLKKKKEGNPCCHFERGERLRFTNANKKWFLCLHHMLLQSSLHAHSWLWDFQLLPFRVWRGTFAFHKRSQKMVPLHFITILHKCFFTILSTLVHDCEIFNCCRFVFDVEHIAYHKRKQKNAFSAFIIYFTVLSTLIHNCEIFNCCCFVFDMDYIAFHKREQKNSSSAYVKCFFVVLQKMRFSRFCSFRLELNSSFLWNSNML